jgi:signal transduction histidine kinase
MNSAIPFRSLELSAGATENAGTTFHAVFEHAPIAVARCNSHGLIVEMNPAFARSLDRSVASRQSLWLCELVPPQERERTDLLLRELLASKRDSIHIEAGGAGHDQASAQWIAWRQPGSSDEPDHALLIAHQPRDKSPVEENLVQTQRWEAVGRMTGGVVHDFNNLLTGVMLYCDLMLSSLDSRDRRRRYAEEIRSATMQATGLVAQLLVFARPRPAPARDLNLNQVARSVHDLLNRLIGENITLDLQLDPELAEVNIDQAQAQQILLNLVLNSRDALPDGGRITIETSNCKFQPLARAMTQGSAEKTTEAEPQLGPTSFPCVLLVVADNGHGMNAETRQRIFDPFFTTKNAGQGTGLGLTTVRSIVTTNRGLIHFESELGRGTRVMILLPRASRSPDQDVVRNGQPDSDPPSETQFPQIKKESLL